MVNSPLIRFFFMGGGVALGGGTLDSHDTKDIWSPIDPTQRSRKNVVPGLSVQISEALGPGASDGVNQKEAETMNDSKEKVLTETWTS